MSHNQRGMSLIELLATLSLVSLIAVLIWTTFTISIKHNSLETNNLMLQQDANYIATEIQRLHRKCKSYTLIIEFDKVAIKNCESFDEEGKVQIDNLKISNRNLYSYKDWIEDENGNIKLKEVDLKNKPLNISIDTAKKNLHIEEFIIKDPSRETVQFSMPLSISRYK